MFSTEEGVPVCVVKGGSNNGEIIFLNKQDKDKNKVVKSPKKIQLEDDDAEFEQLPSDEVRVLYVPAPAGSGKSTYIGKYTKRFCKFHPDKKVFLFSRIQDDPALAEINYKRVVLNEELIENPLQLEEVSDGSLVIFDDIDTISNQKLMRSIYNFQAQLLEMGRHKRIKVCIASHLINGNDRKQSRTIMNEMQSMTIFPASGSVQQIRYALCTYWGLDFKQCTKLLKMKSRWITLFKHAPQILLSEKCLMFMSEL